MIEPTATTAGFRIPLLNLSQFVANPTVNAGNEESLAVGFFDLVNSTERTNREGHEAGVLAVRRHNDTCRALVSHFGGSVVKELGDGLLVTFPNVKNCVLASENFRLALRDVEESNGISLKTRIGLAFGPVEHASIDGRPDIIGATVDRAAKVQSLGAPNQIVIDTAFAQAARERVAEFDGLELIGPLAARVPGLMSDGMYVLASTRMPEVSQTLMNRFQWFEDGRLPPDVKASYITNTKSELIEIGTTLETWAGYFDEMNPSVYRVPIFDRIKHGVAVRCYVLDPDCDVVGPYFVDCPDKTSRRSIWTALQKLQNIKEDVETKELQGKFEVYTYRAIPFTYISGIDIGTVGEPAPFGRIIASSYLHGLKHAENPMLHFTSLGNPIGFEAYRRSIRQLTDNATPFDPARLKKARPAFRRVFLRSSAPAR